MLVIFRYREDASSFSQQVFELCETKLNCYKIQFVEQQAQSTNLSQTMLEIFKKYSQKYTSGKNFFYVNITSDFDSNVISDLLTNFYHNRFCSITEAVTELWDSCHSWGNCFDLINSFLSSKTVAVIKCHFDDYLINFPHNYLCEASDHESDFSIDGGLWSITIVTFPLIQLAQAASTFEPLITAGQGMTTAACHVNQESEEDWEIITTSEEFDSLSLERIEMSEISDEPSTQLENNAHSEKTTTSTSSYRDVLLKPSLAPTTTVRDFPKTVQQKSTWKPVLIVTKTPYLRSDRVYGRQQEEYEDDGKREVKTFPVLDFYV